MDPDPSLTAIVVIVNGYKWNMPAFLLYVYTQLYHCYGFYFIYFLMGFKLTVTEILTQAGPRDYL